MKKQMKYIVNALAVILSLSMFSSCSPSEKNTKTENTIVILYSIFTAVVSVVKFVNNA